MKRVIISSNQTVNGQPTPTCIYEFRNVLRELVRGIDVFVSKEYRRLKECTQFYVYPNEVEDESIQLSVLKDVQRLLADNKWRTTISSKLDEDTGLNEMKLKVSIPNMYVCKEVNKLL